jgi:hypothetical protein
VPLNQHPVDRCAMYRRPGHGLIRRTILVGYACQNHSLRSELVPNQNMLKLALESVKEDEKPSYSDEGYASVGSSTEAQTLGGAKTIRRMRGSVYKEQAGTSHAPHQRVVPASQQIGANSVSNSKTLGVENKESEKSSIEIIAPARNDDANVEVEVFNEDTPSMSTSLLGALKVIGSTFTDTADESFSIRMLADSLIYDKFLRYLWPQLFRRASFEEQAHQDITRQLLRYSLDLQDLAQSVVDLEAEIFSTNLRVGRLIQLQRGILADEICRFFRLPETDAQKRSRQQMLAPPTDRLDTGSIDEDELKRLLFHTDPFYTFRENVQLLLAQRVALPMQVSLFDRAQRAWNNAVLRVSRPELLPGQQRVFYTCVSQTLHQHKRTPCADENRDVDSSCMMTTPNYVREP